MLFWVEMERKKLFAGAVLVALAALAAWVRHPKIATPAEAEVAETGAVNGEAGLPMISSLKRAANAPQDPIAKVEAERLAQTVVGDGALNDPEKLAGVCIQARVACGFELLGDAWNRPESRAPLSHATAEQALAAFVGKDYRLAWVGPVAHVFPAAAGGSLPLDTTLAADVSLNSLSREPAETIHDIAVKLGLQMPAPRPRERRTDLIGASTMPIKNSARYILDYLTRPALLHPSSYVAVYGPGRGGSLSWYWGEPPAW
jgi:hypothetical protein